MVRMAVEFGVGVDVGGAGELQGAHSEPIISTTVERDLDNHYITVMCVQAPSATRAAGIQEHDRAHTCPRKTDAVRIGFLAQENHAVPPPIPGASVSRVVHELALRLARDPRFDVTVCSIPHPTIPEGEQGGMRFLRVDAGLDRLRHELYRRYVTRVPRRLGLPYRPLHGTPFYARTYAERGLRRLRSEAPGIVHLQNVSQFVPRASRILPGVPLVLHMHCDWLLELPRHVVRRRLERVDLVFGVSRHIANGVREAFPELADRCRHLYNGVDIERFRPRHELDDEQRSQLEELRARWGLKDGPIILFVKTICPETGLHVLLLAFERLLQRVPDARLVIAGAFGHYSQASWQSNLGTAVATPATWRGRIAFRRRERHYQDEIAALVGRLGGRAVLVGRRPHEQLPVLYALADVMVVPSVWNEPFGLTALEAAACGVPVVASKRGGLPEFVEDGVTGTIVPADEPEALAQALDELCLDREWAGRLGEAARRRVAAEFGWERQARRLADLYTELL